MEAIRSPQEIYETRVKQLSIVERLQLVKLVLDDLMHDPASWIVDERDEWSAEDLQDLAQASMEYATKALEEQHP